MIDDQTAVLAMLTRQLRERYAPERIVLFGSRARGDSRPDSDYDVLMVLGDPRHDAIDVRRVVQEIHPQVEIFLSSSDAFERRRTDVGTLEYVAGQDGWILYARAPRASGRHVRETPGDAGESLQEWIDRARPDFAAMTALVRSGVPGIPDTIVFHAHS
jgi:predicted nucleotidyltransferase